MTGDFPCTSCGACCKRIGSFEGGEDFRLSNGSCKHLTKENLCGIYETRPEMCRIKKRAEKSSVSTKLYFKYFASVCNRLQSERNMPLELRVKI
jgi:Fe-S-cluster containining protein